MPNWVTMELEVSGEPRAVASFRAAVAGESLALDFERAWKPPAAVEARDWDRAAATAVMTGRRSPEDGDGWTWRVARWGSACQNCWCDEAVSGAADSVAYVTESAGEGPRGLVRHLAAVWPALIFRLTWFGPDSFRGGRLEARAGQVVRDSAARDDGGIRDLVAGTGVADAFERELAFLERAESEADDWDEFDDADSDEGTAPTAPHAPASESGVAR